MTWFWGKQLLYHAGAEDRYMTGPLKDSHPARGNEAEHAALGRQAKELAGLLRKGDAGGLEESIKTAMLELEEVQHDELVEKLHAVQGGAEARDRGGQRDAAYRQAPVQPRGRPEGGRVRPLRQ